MIADSAKERKISIKKYKMQLEMKPQEYLEKSEMYF